MKNVIITTIRDCGAKMFLIAIAGAAIALTGACNNASPVGSDATECVDNWDVAYDAGIDDGLSSCVVPVVDTESSGHDLTDIQSVLAGVIAERDLYKQRLEQEQAEYMALYYACQESSDE